MGDVVGPSEGLRAPRRLNREGEVSLPNRDAMDRMTDTTAVEACQKLASGHMSYITPSHDVWFKWSAPDDRGGDEAEAWYNQCSEIALKELSVSNFYTEIHECFLDRVALGTGSLFTGTSSDGRLLFTNIPCGQFACAENAEGRVDTYVREFAYTAHQGALHVWGESSGAQGQGSSGARRKSVCHDFEVSACGAPAHPAQPPQRAGLPHAV